ncbi:MAG: ParB N-terminal domain-containing protein [Clostridia bacterium]|nr:ParB N-terminal domain-containing protein [Clostridia bacterium]
MGLYYLQSRYYDANIGRFISADGYVSTGQGIIGNNMYAYCGNNPIMRSDRGGAARGYESLDQDGKSMLEDPYFGIDSAYHSYKIYSNTAAYDAYLGGYYYDGGGSIGGYTSNFAIGFPGSVTVTDSMVKCNSHKTTIDTYKLNPTHNLTKSKGKFKKFVKQVQQNGITEPIKYVKYNGKYYVVDGHHRLAAAKLLRYSTVPAIQVFLPYNNYFSYDDLHNWER